jgi:preprotein translocase subunit SecF
MRFFHKTNIDFVGNRGKFFVLSLVVILVGIIGATAVGPVFGIDFVGGTQVVVEYEGSDPGSDKIKDALEAKGLSGYEVKSFDQDNQYIIRVKETEGANDRILDALKSNISDVQFKSLSTEAITAKIGKEMQSGAMIAIFLAVLMILIYVALRFEFVFGLGAIVALLHDVLIAITFIIIIHKTGLINLELNQAVVAALLTVVGFSINDTVIIFDRIRENREKSKNKNFLSVVNESINETLTRTINTLLTAVLALIPIIILGGSALEGFAFTMLIGFIVGTYSSIFIASSFVIWYFEKVRKQNLA